ncbi:AMP-binding protein [Gordonia amarae]|uniref:AMP-binding protein n=2 Tax=Gordonia amarae TaxID=36821 RepID=A0A857MBS6_9ACTN|nr:acyl-CoA synthetase [Gordonia amarae]MCS3877962.1 fatty-acyl-CoA synthase [Gordonia amarae]QHN16669.1 AMP-binding protein [Gordonia amarae]QHN21194.1 AMP-binding protein [Gordonia amarae]QHN30048.1 AMP-binding protein [Gordonia amarae]QHN38821.1 AMP-binding protein [Gordonia amarae]
MNTPAQNFNLSEVIASIARAVGDREFLVWRDRRLTYRQFDDRATGFARFLVSAGLGAHTERESLAGHESGQDHLALYLRNGNEYPEAMVGAYRARVAPFNCSFRYVEDELVYLLDNSGATAIVYNAEFAPRVAAIRDRLPALRVFIQVADDSGNDLIDGAVDYETILGTTEPDGGLPEPSGDDLYILYTGGTTGMPKGVLWRQHDVFLGAMGGRPFGSPDAFESYDAVAVQASSVQEPGAALIIAPFMHGAAQWATFNLATMSARIVLTDRVDGFDAAETLRLIEREKVGTVAIVGDAMARPLIDEIGRGTYDLSSWMVITNGGAQLSPAVRERLLEALPHALVLDAVGSSESGIQNSTMVTKGADAPTAVFAPTAESGVVAEDFSRVLQPGDTGLGWLARSGSIPLGYLGDAAKTAKTFPIIDGVRWSVPGDRANLLPDGRIELLGRDSNTINSGGEKIFVEEVERAIAAHPSVADVLVVGRDSDRWGSEVVAIVELVEGESADAGQLREVCRTAIASYKIPKEFLFTDAIVRSPAGKADYRWAKRYATGDA